MENERNPSNTDNSKVKPTIQSPESEIFNFIETTESIQNDIKTSNFVQISTDIEDPVVAPVFHDYRSRLASDTKFSCKSVISADDPVEEVDSCSNRARKLNAEQDMSLDFRDDSQIRKFQSSRKPNPPTFTGLKQYGYELKLPSSLVRLNVGGTSFIVKLNTLRKDPMVFEKILEDAEWLSDTMEYYLDRDPTVFRFVYCYLRYKELHLPQTMCGPLLEKELETWGIQLGFDLQRCCLGPVVVSKSKLESLKKFEAEFTETVHTTSVCCGKNANWAKIREDVWHVIGDNPKKRWLTTPPMPANDELAGWIKEAPFSDYFNNTIGGQFSEKSTVEQTVANFQTVSFKLQPELNGEPEASGNFETTFDESNKFTPLNLQYIKHHSKLKIIGRFYLYLQTLLTCLMIFLLIFNYMPQLRVPYGPNLKLNISNETGITPTYSFLAHRLYFAFNEMESRVTRPMSILILLMWICIISLSLDLIVRVLFCPNILRWFFSIYAITDILSLIPFYAELFLYGIIDNYPNTPQNADYMLAQLKILDIINLLKICVAFRLFRLLKRHRPTRVLLYTIRTSAFNMLMIFELMGLCAIIFGTAIFLLDVRYVSVFNGMWWAFITMATVGYGDIVPSSTAGYLLAVPCVMVGILLTSYTIPILVNDFLLYYSHADQMAWMRRVHSTATVRRNKERRNMLAKRRMSRVRALLKNRVIGSYTVGRNNATLKNN